MSFASENSIFYKYKFLVYLEGVLSKKNYVSIKELLTSFSY